MNCKHFIPVLIIFFLPKTASSQINEKTEFDKNLKISLPGISITILDVKYDEYSETSIISKNGETAIVNLGLGEEIWDKTIKVLSNDLSNVKIYQRYETSVTISDEGPHLDLIDWKHYQSEWKELLRSENGNYRTADFDSDYSNHFSEIDIEELKQAVLKQGGKRWYKLVENINSPTQYPSSIGVNKIELLVTGYINNKKIEKTIVFNLPLGC